MADPNTHPYPIITLTVERMKETIRLALADYTLSLDASIQQELERVCSDAAIKTLVAGLVEDEVRRACRETVDTFFRYGDGRKAVSEAVIAAITKGRATV